MREHVSQDKNTTTGFSVPTLKQPTRGFGLDSSEALPQAVTTVQPLNKPAGHDISRISLRPQAKLTVNHPGDIYEQEADRVAQQVMRRMTDPVNRQSVQRQEMPEEEEELQMKSQGSVNRPEISLVSTQKLPIQRYTNPTDTTKQSENSIYTTSFGDQSKELGCATPNQLPQLPGLTWQSTNKNLAQLPSYLPNLMNKPLEVPQDCLMVAELVQAWINKQDPTRIGIVANPPSIKAAAHNKKKVEVGEIMLASKAPTDWQSFHAATVIAKDGQDAVTMEGDASEGEMTTAMQPDFDLREGPAGLRNDNDMSKVYVIKVGEGREPQGKTLWKDITDNTFTESGREAANKILAILKSNAEQIPSGDEMDTE